MYLLEQFVFFLILSNEIHGSILLYNTENTLSALEYFDCIYYQNGSVVKYCRRSSYQDFLDRSNHSSIPLCSNNGQHYTFEQLIELDIKPTDILKWSSSIEQVDHYAAYLLNPNLQMLSSENAFLCNCTLTPLTFGKYCEYTLPPYGITFDAIVIKQFELKRNSIGSSQEHGNILCYESLFECNYGMLCLDWRDICDGEQQCMDGSDEENCDRLEFNECNNDEYRCSNGMCIPDQYFLDGEYDCMDFSDEQDKFNSVNCIFNSRSLDCDEHLCRKSQWSCGDGQCIPIWDRFIFQNFILKTSGCYNYRDYNFLCELKHLWTMPTGLCYPFWIEFDLDVNGDRDEYCQYLLKCALSGGKELQCPCGSAAANCSMKIKEFMCSERSLLYPMKSGVIKPYMQFYYDINHNWLINKDPDKIIFNGSIKCRGYQARGTMLEFDYNENFILYSQFDFHFCNSSKIEKIYSGSFYDENCWTGKEMNFSYRFSDICQRTSRYCISDYRLYDGYDDCGGIQSEDEEISTNHTCFNQQKYRFTCSNEQQPTCLLVEVLGNNVINCLNRYDEFLFGEEISLVNIKPQLLRQYIEYSSMKNHSIFQEIMSLTTKLTHQVIPYDYYCDTFWDISSKDDEKILFCKEYWICRKDQYRCLTGQCIPTEWLCDGEWDCADASDEQRLFIIEEFSEHNQLIEDLEKLKTKCFQRYQNQSAFSTICNITKEYPCFRSNITDIIQHRPCINLSQIGDDISDCYGNFDERNLLNGCNSIRQMGYDFHCNDDHHQCILGVFLCERHCQNQYDQSLCFHRRSLSCAGQTDVLCLTGECKRRARCDGEIDCPNGEDEYWCSSEKSLYDIIYYRRTKQDEQRQQQQMKFQLKDYPFSLKTKLNENNHVFTSRSADVDSDKLAFYCNRGISIIHEGIVCFCPPSYYGSKCQFYSDRITVITHVNFTNTNYSKMDQNLVIKIVVLFVFEIDTILDYHEFHTRPSIENSPKHQFYFLYSRSPIFLEHKRKRYLNRTNIIEQQPYQIRFEAYELNSNNTIKFIGLWQYPIYFDYLPSFRLVKILTFPKEMINNPCHSNPCQSTNMICQSIFNENQTYLCLCKDGYYGDDCQNYDKQCQTYCSLNSTCKLKYRGILSAGNQYPLCLCPLDYFGPSCHLRHDHCDSVPCLNNGSCYTTYDLTGIRPYTCQCIEEFYGDQCQYEKISIFIQLKTVSTESLASVIQYYDIDNITNDFILKHQRVYRSIPTIFRYNHGQQIAPILSILKLYNRTNQCHYHILYIQQNQSLINITSTVSIINHCVDVLALLSNISSSVKFQYHQLCQQWRNKSSIENLKCFYDDDYFCICDSDFYRAECFGYNHYLDQCQLCLSGGRCLKGNIQNKHDFLCLCPQCHSGDHCEFNNELFSFTLDSLIVKDTFAIQLVYVLITCVMFVIGSFNNLCSFVTFKKPKPRKIGVGNYLFVVTIFNQLSLIVLLMKILFIVLTNNHIYIDIYFSCKIISYFLSVFTRTNYWLTSLVNIERVGMIFWPTKTTFKKPIVALTLSILIFIIISGMHIHEFLYYTVLNRSVCVVDYARLSVSIYNRINILFHHLIPFCIQIITITILIILTAKSRFRGQKAQTTFRETFKKQFISQKESYITPIIIIFSSLPHIILAFNFTCTPIADQQWQRYLLLTTYFFSYSPQILGFILYVLPSTTYKQEFQETTIGKCRIFQWLFKRPAKLDVSKTKVASNIKSTDK